ncbi:hypothetical protein D3C76_1049160 [compost metagenome]
MNLSRERIESIRQKAQHEALLAPDEVVDLIGHNDHLTQLCEARARLLLAAESETQGLREHKQLLVDLRETHGFDSWAAALVEIDRLRSESEALRKDAERYRWLKVETMWGDEAIDRVMAKEASHG